MSEIFNINLSAEAIELIQARQRINPQFNLDVWVDSILKIKYGKMLIENAEIELHNMGE